MKAFTFTWLDRQWQYGFFDTKFSYFKFSYFRIQFFEEMFFHLGSGPGSYDLLENCAQLQHLNKLFFLSFFPSVNVNKMFVKQKLCIQHWYWKVCRTGKVHGAHNLIENVLTNL